MIAVVVPRLHPQRQGDPRLVTRLGQQLGTQLLGQELVGIALIDQQVGQSRAVLDQGNGIRLSPGGAVLPQIAAQRLLTPGHLGRRDDGREGRHAAEAVRVAQTDGQRTVAAHRVAGDRLRVPVGDREMLGDQRGQLLLDIGPHPEVRGPGFLCRIDIETGPLPHVIGVVIGHAFPTRRGVGCDEDHPVLGASGPELTLVGDIGMGAGQARQIPEDRKRLPLLMLGHEDREGHAGAGRAALVRIDALHAAMRLGGRYRLDRHRNTTVRLSLRKTRRSPTQATARASTCASISRPMRIRSSTLAR